MSLNIRQAVLSDLDRIAEIEPVCFSEKEAASLETLKSRLERFGSSFQVLEAEGEIVGFINGSIIDGMVIQDKHYSDASLHNSQNDVQSIFGLCVLPEYRNHGYASQLVKAFIQTAEQSGKKGLTLCCKKEKIHFYETLGFTNHGKSDSEHGNAEWYNMILLLKDQSK